MIYDAAAPVIHSQVRLFIKLISNSFEFHRNTLMQAPRNRLSDQFFEETQKYQITSDNDNTTRKMTMTSSQQQRSGKQSDQLLAHYRKIGSPAILAAVRHLSANSKATHLGHKPHNKKVLAYVLNRNA
ncbi:hypothetical protein ACLBWZ_04775 [Brucellaceae bacterium C25G]